MKRLVLAFIAASFALPTPSIAGNACEIWLCMPIGFAHPACNSARNEMYRRIFRGKSPVPSFASCTVDGQNPTGFSFASGNAIYYRPAGPSGFALPGTEMVMLENAWCNHRDTGHEEPRGCTTTISYMKMFENGVQIGPTIYTGRSGPMLQGDPVTGEISVLPDYQ